MHAVVQGVAPLDRVGSAVVNTFMRFGPGGDHGDALVAYFIQDLAQLHSPPPSQPEGEFALEPNPVVAVWGAHPVIPLANLGRGIEDKD